MLSELQEMKVFNLRVFESVCSRVRDSVAEVGCLGNNISSYLNFLNFLNFLKFFYYVINIIINKDMEWLLHSIY